MILSESGSADRTTNATLSQLAVGLNSFSSGRQTVSLHLVPNSFYTFIGGERGPWRIHEIRAVTGAAIDPAPRLEIVSENLAALPPGARWLMRGVTSNTRYTHRAEQDQLTAMQPVLGRPEATCAALIPITKSTAWWALTQDERREIFEARSAHIATGLRYLPAIARRLHHGRDLGEPFDFLTWFEYAPADAPAFERLVGELRGTEEWRYVEREIDLRLVRAAPAPREPQPLS